MTLRVDLTGIITAMVFDGTSPTLMRTHAMRNGMGSHALMIIISSISLCSVVT